MKTRTEKKPTWRLPSITARPPTSRVIVKPNRMAIRIRGTNADEKRIARPLATR